MSRGCVSGCEGSVSIPIGGAASKRPDLSAREVADELERLRGLRDKGELSEEDYERARERLRRY